MNTKQYADYYNDAYNTMKNGMKGNKYREVELLGDAAATIATNQMQMELQREESEKAYERSKASNQVSLMMQAGMSRAGAINALNGGGSYTPAPISLESPKPGTGVSNVRQNDLATAQNALSGINSMVANWQQYQQIKNQNEQFYKQLETQKEMQKEQIASQERIAKLNADTTNRNADNRLRFDKEQFDKLSPYQIREIEANIAKIKAETKISNQQLEDLQYRYAEYVANRKVRDAVSLFQELEATYNYHVTESDFNDFKRSYMWYNEETGEYEYISHTKPLTAVEGYVSQFWDVMAKIFPANQLARIIRGALK